MNHQVANNAVSTLAGNITNVAVSLTLNAGDGAKFPALAGAQYFYTTLATPPAGPETTREIVKVTARAGDVLTIVRAQQGTAASAFSTGDKCELRITKALIDLVLDTESDQASIAGKKSFNDGKLAWAGINRIAAQAAVPADPLSGEIGIWARAHVNGAFPVPLPAWHDGLGSTNRVPGRALLPLELGGSWHHWQWDLGGTFRGFGKHAMTTKTGTAGVTSWASGSYRGERGPRLTLATGAGANSAAGITSDAGATNAQVRSIWRGSVAGRGGFFFQTEFDFPTLTAVGRVFIGPTGDTGSFTFCATANLSTFTTTDFIGLGSDDNDANLTIVMCDGTTVAKIPLDTPTAKTAANGKYYRLTISCAPNSSDMYVTLEEFTTGYGVNAVLFDHVINTAVINGVTPKLPRNTAIMRPVEVVNSGNNTPAVQVIGIGEGSLWVMN